MTCSGGERCRASRAATAARVGTSTDFEQPEREFSVVALLVRRVFQPVYVEIGQDAQQGRAHVDPTA